jgi:hypothetical protein
MINVGFIVTTSHIENAIIMTNTQLQELPSTLFQSIDYKTTSAMIGAIFCDTLATLTGSTVNPIEKGHPDIIPISGIGSPEHILRKYPEGLEIKCTVGNIKTGANLRAGETRISQLTGVTWQAHHREVKELLGLVWDFIHNDTEFNYPTITAAFYTNDLNPDDWGVISGTTGRNTKVTGMSASGKIKMGKGCISLINKQDYLLKYKSIFKMA